MFVVAQHDIHEPAHFWEVVRSGMEQLPPGLRLHLVFPDAGGCKAACLWEAETLEDVVHFVDLATQAFSQNLFFEVEPRYAIGLPNSRTEGLPLY